MSDRKARRLAEQVAAGNRAAGDELLAALADAPDAEARAVLLDPLALTAATSRPALDLLLDAVDRHRLAAPAIHSLLVNPDDMDEVAQDVLIAVSRSIHSFRAESRFTTWLSAVARNTSIAYLRRKRDAARLDDQREVSTGARLSSMIATRDTLRAAIDELEPIYRDPLVLRDVHQRSYQEVADELGLPLNTAKSRIFRARAILAGTLRPEEMPDA